MSESPLSQDQIDQYWRDGYTVVPGLIPDSDLAVYDQRFEDIVLGKVERNDRMLVMKDVMVAKGVIDPKDPLERIQKVQDFELDPVLDTYCHHPKILECVEGLIGEGVMTIHNMLINKPPNVDGRHPFHQDLLYFPFRPADRIVATWTALEPCTRENGCTSWKRRSPARRSTPSAMYARLRRPLAPSTSGSPASDGSRV